MGQVVDMAALEGVLAVERRAGKQIVLTNGCFDLLHVGHARLLASCQQFGDVLVVGVNGDQSVALLKGSPRPFVPAAERAELVAALSPVDYVAVFSERTAERLAALVRPDVYVKGADYATGAGRRGELDGIDEDRLPEAAVVRAHGGRVVLVPLVPDRSSSALAVRIQEAAR
jgi:D-beta-D-heptose 7-phosphate kinase/D-beta-D-heptose 1-phosphate adenosyltransferase